MRRVLFYCFLLYLDQKHLETELFLDVRLHVGAFHVGQDHVEMSEFLVLIDVILNHRAEDAVLNIAS